MFESEGAKRSFEKTLDETCERSGWILHAWVIMGNHLHSPLDHNQWVTSLDLMEVNRTDLFDQRKAADWKVAIAAKLKTKFLCRNGWLSERLDMGAESAVSRYCAELQQGSRPGAGKLFDLIIANSKD